MIKNVLVIVPHQDDELNIAGFLFESFIEQSIKINILYVTKGNFYKERHEARQKERDRMLKRFGNISYRQLEYDDSYLADGHIFNDNLKRSEIKSNIKGYIKELMCDLLICVDYDSHADHRMVSALFDESILELIKEFNYRPIVLKKFAYLGVWNGNYDYFAKICIETQPVIGNNNYDPYVNTLPYSWKDRIQVATNSKDCSLKFWKSKMFRAYCCYFTQCGFKAFFRAANADITYWHRNTNNKMLLAYIISTSGEKSFINDFAVANIEKITDHFFGEKRFGDCAWVPSKMDPIKGFVATWSEPIRIKTIKIFQNFLYKGHIDCFSIKLNNGYQKTFTCTRTEVEKFTIPVQDNIIRFEFYMNRATGDAGIRELEIFEDDEGFPWNEVPFKRYDIKDKYVDRKFIFLYKFVADIWWVVLRGKNKIRKFLRLSSW